MSTPEDGGAEPSNRGESTADGAGSAASAAPVHGQRLREIFPGVAALARRVIPFERVGVSLIEDDTTVRAFIIGDAGALTETTWRRGSFSDVLWPRSDGSPAIVTDAPSQLDPRFEADRRILDDGLRSVIVVALAGDGRDVGTLWAITSAANAFVPEHAEALRPIADLLVRAVEHDRLRELELLRRRRYEKLDALLPAVAGALDVREVLPRMSAVIQQVIPHDALSLSLFEEEGAAVKIYASSFEITNARPPHRFHSAEEARGWLEKSHHLVYEHTLLPEGISRARLSPPGALDPIFLDTRPSPLMMEKLRELDLRSELRVPIREEDRVLGGLSFSSHRAYAYGEEDVPFAVRIADHVRLALAHERLAEEARRLAQARERESLLQERVDVLVRELEGTSAHRALGSSARWKNVLADAAKVADTDTTVLITGESGTGKEVVARYVHRGSRRAEKPFVAINCAALPEQLLESELFGWERGAFTGAHGSRAGKIEQAAGGVLFLDEVGEMTPPVQAKFLRVLQEREFQRLGGTKTIKADVRVIAATNRDPKLAMERGTLREDLYYRLSVFEIALPALRERPDDILPLAEAFLQEIGRSVGRPAAGISEDARDRLLQHGWPGNVRELRNAIERAVILAGGGLVTSEHLPIAIARVAGFGAASAPGAITPTTTLPAHGLDAVEKDLLQKALAQAADNKSQAAKLLGLPRGRFYSLLRKHGLTDARR
jgi:Nif-specific regulatory protein